MYAEAVPAPWPLRPPPRGAPGSRRCPGGSRRPPPPRPAAGGCSSGRRRAGRPSPRAPWPAAPPRSA